MKNKEFLQVALIKMDEHGLTAKTLGCKQYEVKNNKIPNELVSEFVKQTTITTERVFGKLTTVMKYELANGFTGIESTSCVDEDNYSEEVGTRILMGRLKDKIWFGLGFALGMAQ